MSVSHMSNPGIRVSLQDLSEVSDLKQIRDSAQKYLQSLSSNARRQIKRSISLYEERGPLKINVAGSVEEAFNYFEDAGVLHQKRWVVRGKPGAFANPFYIKFHRALIERCFPHSRVEFARISVADEPIGYYITAYIRIENALRRCKKFVAKVRASA